MDEKDVLIKKLLEENAALKQIIEMLTAKIAELEKRLNKNSKNSSKPPSSDGLSKPPRTTSLRESGKRKSGGQFGHPGETLRQVSNPNEIKTHSLLECPSCQISLSDIDTKHHIKRQVFDIPKIEVYVTEHRAEIKVCPLCRQQHSAVFPSEVRAPVQYGKTIQSMAVYLQHQQLLPEQRLQQTFKDLWNLSIATTTLNTFSELAYDNLETFEKDSLSIIQAAPVKHLDETGFRVCAKTQWLHVASTETHTYYHVSPQRKALLKGLKGTVVHDYWQSYYLLDGVTHGLCNQHHLRELQALIDHEKESWAKQMQRFLRFSLRYRRAYGEEMIPEEKLNRLIKHYEMILKKALIYHEGLPLLPQKSRGRIPHRTGHNLALRLQLRSHDVLRFLKNSEVPFTNNQAEQDIRMMKCKQKISGGFRSQKGAHIFARIRGFISTLRKQGFNIFEAIQGTFQEHQPQHL